MRDDTLELKRAIEKLDAFSKKITAAQKSSPVSKTITLMRSLLSDPQQHASRNEILQAIELINRQRLLIQQLQTGTPAEQKLAESFTKVIAVYNEMLDKPLREQRSKKIFKIFSKRLAQKSEALPKIDLPHKQSIEYHYSESSEILCPEKMDGKRFSTFLQPDSNILLSQQSIELFHMKTLSLLERYGIATNPEARAPIKQAPIHTLLEKTDHTTCMLTQTLTLFPGQTIHIRGESHFDPKTRKIHKISPETFSISIESDQTGYPHALQRAGWSLSHRLIHDCPQRLDLMRESAEIVAQKKKIIQTLQPQTNAIEKAKALIKLKKLLVQEHAAQFIELHRQLALALVQSALGSSQRSSHSSSQSDFQFIHVFYDNALKDRHPFEWIAQANAMVSEYFIVAPYQALLHAILHLDRSKFCGTKPENCFQEAFGWLEKIYDDAEKKVAALKLSSSMAEVQIKLNYIEGMGKVLGSAVQAIMLQYLSEDLMFKPPLLTPFTQKIQAAAYRHVQDFMTELSSSIFEPTYLYLKNTLEEDIALFENRQPLAIPAELHEYFEQRYQNLNRSNFRK
jgi:hypothetical protein